MKKFTLLSILSLFLLSACNTLPVDTSPQTFGSADAPILVEEFSDPQCPACASTSPQLEQLIRDNPELASFAYYHFPLSQHEYAFIAAEASECAADQGKFWEYLNQIFEGQRNLSEDYIYKVADALDLNRTAFDACIDNHDHKKKILAHMAEGSRRRIPGTPTIFVNGNMVRWNGADSFKEYLESL